MNVTLVDQATIDALRAGGRVPVVLEGRTEPCGNPYCVDGVEWFGKYDYSGRRIGEGPCYLCGGSGERSVAPVQVATPCPDCDGSGCNIDNCESCGYEYTEPCASHRAIGHPESSNCYTDDFDCPGCCLRCGGSGWVGGDLGLAIEQCRDIEALSAPNNWRPWCGNDPGEPWHERRQVVLYRTQAVEAREVVDQDHPLACLDFGDERTHLLMVVDPDTLQDVTDEPWAADLRPGQWVVWLEGLEELDQPINTMPCDARNGCEHDPIPRGALAAHRAARENPVVSPDPMEKP